MPVASGNAHRQAVPILLPSPEPYQAAAQPRNQIGAAGMAAHRVVGGAAEVSDRGKNGNEGGGGERPLARSAQGAADSV